MTIVRWLGIGLTVIGLLGIGVTTIIMMLAFQSAGAGTAPSIAALANEVSFSLIFSLAGGLCFVVGLVLLIVDVCIRWRLRGQRPSGADASAE